MNKDNWTPEEIELKEALNKVYENDTRIPSKPLDLSFLNDDKEVEVPSIKKASKRWGWIAAIFAIIVVTSFSTAIFISNGYVTAIQQNLQKKVFESNSNVIITSDSELMEEGETIWEISDYDTAVKAKKIVPDLPVPTYVPDEYEFVSLTLYLYSDDSYSANYIYSSSQNDIFINIQPTEDNSVSFSDSPSAVIEHENFSMTLWSDPISGSQGATIFFENNITSVSTNDLSLKESDFTLIANNL